jgi:hypothetical protein
MEEHATALVEASAEYVGRWNRLVSTTNWEKGRIISEWRSALRETDAPAESYTDDAWSRQVGNLTPQHVGRLRRVYERFGQVYQQYPGIFWSHFQAAIDWPDAEMYLEGAVQNGWSVSELRNQRWEVSGRSPEEKPLDADIVNEELDEDAFADRNDTPPPTISESISEVHSADDFSDDESHSDSFDAELPEVSTAPPPVATAAPLRPFASLPPLPSDLNEGFELMKLAILNHKVSGWQEIACDDVLAVLESLRQLALAPAE